MQPTSYDYVFKICLIGPEASGKTMLLNRYVSGSFTYIYAYTVGVDFGIRTLDLNNKRVKLQIWDLAGQRKFDSITGSYLRGPHPVLIACDLSKQDFVKNVQEQVERLLNRSNFYKETTPIVLVGTKKDQLSDDTAEKAAEQKLELLQQELVEKGYNCISYQLTSAKTGEGVNELFTAVATKALEERLKAEQGVKPRESIHVSSSSEQTAKPKKTGSELWNHFKEHPKRYIFGLLLATSIAVVLAVPIIGQAVGLAGAIGFLAANTAWQLGLLAAGAALLGFVACMLGGKLIDKIKRSRSNKGERLLEQENKRGNEQHIDAASTSTETHSILDQPIHGHPAGINKTAAQPHQSGSEPAPDSTGVPTNK